MALMLMSDDGRVVRLRALGRIESPDPEPAADPFGLAGENGYARRVSLCLERTDFLDSAGIAWLVASHKRFERHGGKLVMHSVPPQVMQVLKILRLDRVLKLARNDAEAEQQLLADPA